MQNIEIQVADFFVLLLSWGIILFGMILAVILFFKPRGRKISNRILAFLLLVGAFYLINKLIRLVGLASQFWSLWVLPLNFTLFIPILIYFYLKFRLHPSSFLRPRDLLHFLFPGIHALLQIVLGFSSLTFKTKIWKNGFLNGLYLTEDIAFTILSIAYSIAALNLFKAKKMEWSVPLNKWLLHLFSVLVGLLLAQIFLMSFFYYRPNANVYWFYIEYLLFSSFLLFISIKAWDQYFPERIFGVSPLFVAPKTVSSDPQHQDWFEVQTKRLFEEEKIFLNPDLDLAMLCKAYGLPKRRLSECIQATFNKNFNELINHFRIGYVVSCLKEGQYNQYNILSIGYSAGFASKSTFYRAFKKEMDCSPSEYIEQLKKLDSNSI